MRKADLLSSAAVNDLALSSGNPGDQRLDTGMKVSEAIARAAKWWDASGRKLIRNAQNGRGIVASAGGDDGGFVPSGILQGLAWAYLTRDECRRVVKVWHHVHVRRPDLLDKASDDPFRLTVNRERVQ